MSLTRSLKTRKKQSRGGKLMRRKILSVAIVMICITLFSSAMVNAGAGTKTASNSYSEYSWCGLFIYSMGVEGNYHSNGKKIDKWSTTRAITSTSGTWSVHDKSSSWINQEATRGDVKAYATFKNGLCTAWFDLAWQTEDRSCTATAKA